MRRMHSAWRIVIAAATVVAIVMVMAGLALYRPASAWVDAITGTSTRISRVTAAQTDLYCPARMTLADTAEYGDSEFRPSEGNIASASRYLASGSVYQAIVSSLDGSSASQDLSSSSLDDGGLALQNDSSGDSRLLSASSLDVESGTGLAASTASWATSGDLRGMSAASCVVPALTQTLVLSGTRTGTTQQLVVANPSAKSTAVGMTIWGTDSAGRMTPSTGSTVTVPADGEKTVDLSAAASGQEGLVVTLSSTQTPVAAVVRSVVMDGLSVGGSDYALPAAAASRSESLPGVAAGDAVRVVLFSRRSGHATLSWLTSSGSSRAGTVTLTASQVSSVDLGTAPKGAYALAVSSDSALIASAVATRSNGSGQSDFAYLPASSASKDGAVALPAGLSGTLVAVNASDVDVTATVRVYDSSGNPDGSRSLTVAAGSATGLDLSSFDGSAAAVAMQSSGGLSWGVRASSADLSRRSVAAVAFLGATALEPTLVTVRTSRNQNILQ